MSEMLQLYVKNTSNCDGLPLQTFDDWLKELAEESDDAGEGGDDVSAD